MAKELAQTMGGKRIGLLIAILATFAVLATMGNQLVSNSANAAVGTTTLTCPDGLSAGGDVSCTVTTGTNAAGDFNVTVTVPGTSPTADAAICDAGADTDGVATDGLNSVNCLYNSDGSLSATMTYTGTVDAQANCAAPQPLVATANVADSASDTDSDTEEFTLNSPCLTVDKTVAPLACGDLPCDGSYTVTIDNTEGEGAAYGVAFMDELDDRLLITGVSFAAPAPAEGECTFVNSPAPLVTCDDIIVAAGGQVMVDIFFTMSSSDIPVDQPGGSSVENSLADNDDDLSTCVTSDSIDGLDDESLCDPNISGDATFTFAATASASLTKVASPSVVSSNPTQEFSWIFQITNTGTVPLTDLTLVDGQLDGGTGSFTALPVTFTGSLEGACVVTPGIGGTLDCDFNAGTGTGDASPITQLNPGESITVTVPMETVLNATDDTIVFNDATFDATEITEITAGGTISIVNNPRLTISKSLVDGPTVGGAGSNDSASFVIVIDNPSGEDATSVDLEDVLPDGLEFVGFNAGNDAECVEADDTIFLNVATIAAGDTITCDFEVQLAAGIVSPLTSFLNTAVLTADAPVGELTASATVQASVPDLSLVKESSGQVSASDDVTFTITVTNDGNSDAADVDITDTLPAGLGLVSIVCPTGFTPDGDDCLDGEIGEGEFVTVTIVAELTDLTIDDETVLVNIAAVTADNATGSMDSANTTVNAPALTIVKTNAPTTVGQDSIVTSTIVVTNSGSEPLDSITIVDDLPAGTTFVPTGSSAACSLVAGNVECDSTVASIPVGASVTFVVRFNVNDESGVITNVVTATGYIDDIAVLDSVAEASVTVVPAAGGGLVHVDIDAASESAAHGVNYDPNQVLHDPGSSEDQPFLQDDVDDVTGSMHTVCLISDELGADEQGQIVWNILPTPGSSATVSPAGGTKSVLEIVDEWEDDAEANCVSWRSAGVGGQTITATDTLTGTVYYLYGTEDSPVIKEWNDIDSTKIVAALGNVGETLFDNTQDLESWTSISGGGTCVRDWNVSTTDVNCVDRTNLDGTTVSVPGSTILVGGNAGNIIAGNASFIEYAFGDHADYAGTVDGVEQTFTVSGTCGSVRLEDPVTGNTIVLWPGDSETILNSDKGVAFQVTPTDNGSTTTTTGNADCSPNEVTTVTISSQEDVQLRSDFDTAPDETVSVRWVVAPPPQKQILLAWAGQRVILEHDWRIAGSGPAYDVPSEGVPAEPVAGTICPISGDEGGAFTVQHIRGSGPGNFLPSLDVEILGNDNAWAWVDSDTDQVEDNNDIEDGNENCISRVLYESEDQGQVDIEAFIIDEGGINSSKIAFVIYYMKFESIELSIVDQVSKPNHNAPSKTIGNVAPYDWGDYAPGNPWDASDDNATGETEWNVSADLLIRGRVKGWFTNSNPSGRLYDNSNPLNVLPADRWVMPDDWDLLAGGPSGEEVYGTAEEFRPGYDLMIAPNNVGPLNDGNTTPFLCDTPFGGCSETLTALFAQTYDIVYPVEGPYSLLDLVGPTSAALSNLEPTMARNTIVRDGDVDWWDAPMPAAPVSIDLRESGFLKQVLKEDVYWTGTVNGHYGSPTLGGQDFTNPFYGINVPDSAFIPATAAGGGFLWDSFGPDGVGLLGQGVYEFWTALPQFLGYGLAATDPRSANVSMGYVSDATLTTALRTELAQIRVAYGALSTDPVIAAEAQSIGRALVVFTDNHGEFMVQANGDFNLTYADCDTNVFGGGYHCAQDDLVGTSLITSTVDYPDFRGKHFPIKSNSVSVDWTWGGYKEVTIEDGETDQFKYIVFRALDRDGFCSQTLPGSVSLHPVLSSWDAMYTVGANDPVEYVDFLIDAGEGIIVSSNGGSINDGKQFATGVPTYSTLQNTTIKEFAPLYDGADECQAWVRVSNSLLGILNVMTTAYDDEGDIGFDRIIDFSSTASYELTFRWSLITWAGQDNISPTNALKGTVGDGANDIFDEVTAVYGWNQASQTWLGFFPAGVSVPGANDLTALRTGQAYWIAIKGPDSVTWTIGTDVN